MQKVKYKYIISLFIIGFVVNLYGALLKILHAANADNIFKIAFCIMTVAGLATVLKLIISKDPFLNN